MTVSLGLGTLAGMGLLLSEGWTVRTLFRAGPRRRGMGFLLVAASLGKIGLAAAVIAGLMQWRCFSPASFCVGFSMVWAVLALKALGLLLLQWSGVEQGPERELDFQVSGRRSE